MVEKTEDRLGKLAKVVKGILGKAPVEVVDVGDVEVVKFGKDLLVTMPKGKDVYLIHVGSGLISSKAKRLTDIV